LVNLRGEPVDLVQKALRMLKGEYFKKIDAETEEKLVYAALRGMTTALQGEPFNDGFTLFYDPELYADLQAQTTGEYEGVGILMGLTDDVMYPQIVMVFPDTPAEEAGLEPDDIITEVDDADTFGMLLPEVAVRIKGEPGSQVHLAVYRPSEGEFAEFDVMRRDVQFSSVSDVQLVGEGVGYIKIINFAEQTAADFHAGMEELLAQGMEALVIDLRNNAGGLFDAALDVASFFVPADEPLVEVEYRGEMADTWRARSDVEKYELPLVVLLNAQSASASEILAGALRDHGLAKMVGEKSFGKGVIQAVNPLETEKVEFVSEDGEKYTQDVVVSAMAITIGQYFTPLRHQEIHGIGIEPQLWFDINNRLASEPELKALDEQIQAKLSELRTLRSQLNRHLREHDAIRSYAAEVAHRLALGEEIADVPRLEPEQQEHQPLAVVPPSADDGSALPQEEPQEER
jgi:carboxyl-terminal processing protease